MDPNRSGRRRLAMDLRRVPGALAALLTLSPARGLAATPAPIPETMDDDAIVLPDAGGPLQRIDTRRVSDQTGARFDIVTWSDAYGRHRVTVEPAGRAPASNSPIEMDGGASTEIPGPDAGRDAADATVLTAGTPPGRWTSLGPDGGPIVALRVSPLDSKVMLAGPGNVHGFGPLHTIYRSTDGC